MTLASPLKVPAREHSRLLKEFTVCSSRHLKTARCLPASVGGEGLNLNQSQLETQMGLTGTNPTPAFSNFSHP